MTDLPSTGAEQKREGELYISEVIELAQLNGAKFSNIDNSWRLLDEKRRPMTIFHMASWTLLGDAALAYCKFYDLPLERTRYETDRASVDGQRSRDYCEALFDRAANYPSHDEMRRKYES